VNSLFVRIYWGMLVAALVVVSVAVITFQHVNTLRYQEFRDTHIAVLMDLAETQLNTLPNDDFFKWIGDVSRRLNGQLSMLEEEKLKITPGAMQKLKKDGRVVVFEPRLDQVSAYMSLPGHPFYIRIILGVGSKEYLPSLATIIFDFLDDYKHVQISSGKLDGANSKLEVFRPDLDEVMSKLGELQQVYLQRGYVVAVELDGQSDSQTPVYYVRQNQNQLLAWGPVVPFDPYPGWLVFLFGSVSIIFIGCIGYFLVRPLESGMKQMESAIDQIRHGNLNARVYIDTNDAIGDLASTINEMAEHIQRLIKSQREMTNAVSHELRTPVARIRFGLQIIQDFVDTPSVDDQCNKIDGDIEELEKLIDEILTYATLEEGRPALDLDMIDINAIANEVRQQSLNQGHKIKINVTEAPTEDDLNMAECERRYIHRAVQNLVNNAVKYAVSEVRVTCSCEGGMFRVDVEDDGPGIPQDQWENVFTPFARLDSSRNRSTGGYGLGLSIVKSIAYWHGGVAAVYFGELGGAKFTILWPRSQNIRKTLEIENSHMS